MLTIYHNPRCSKSRQTLELIKQHTTDNTDNLSVIEYLKTPLTVEEISSLVTQLNCSPIEMMRVKEAEFIAQNLKGSDDETLINAMANTPKLIERPIVSNGSRAIIGRPPENVLTFFS
jgi:arsenate reductase